MRRLIPLALCALAVAALPACDGSSAGAKATASADPALPASSRTATRFNEIAEQYYDDYLALHPLEATLQGDHRYDDRFGDYASLNWLADSLAAEQDALRRLAQVDPNRLAPQERLGFDAFKREREVQVEGYRYPTELLPAAELADLPLQFAWFGSGQGPQPFRTTRDYDNFLSRMDGFTRWVDHTIDNLRAGVAKGVVEHRAVVERVLPPLLAIGVQDPRQSVFWGPILNFPAGLSVADRRRLVQAYAEKLGTEVLPAYRRLHDYLQREYLPHARTTGGLGVQPNGDAWYAYLVRLHGDTSMTPAEVHDLGARETARLRTDIEHIKAQLGGAGDAPAFVEALHADAQFRFSSAGDLLAAYGEVRGRVTGSLPLMFTAAPRATLEIRPVESFRAKFAEAVGYTPIGTGTLYVNTSDLATRSRFLVEAQFLAAGLPGRHLQSGLAAEAVRLPRFQRFGRWSTAYREGWAAYAQSLGRDLGVYADGHSLLGELLLQARTSAQLVVDTGLHAKGWTRTQAVDYLRANAGLDEASAAADVDACLARPGEALGAALGELKLLELRRRAQQKLGARFDIREFHAQVLGSGVLPLAVLEEKIDRWIAAQQR